MTQKQARSHTKGTDAVPFKIPAEAREIIDCCLSGGSAEDDQSLIPNPTLAGPGE